MQDILLVLLWRAALGQSWVCHKGFLVAWSCASLQLEAGLKIHQGFDDVLHLVHQDRINLPADAILHFSLYRLSLLDSFPRSEELVHNLDQGKDVLVCLFSRSPSRL